VIDAALKALGDNASPKQIRERVVRAYAHWQRIPYRTAALIFAPI